MFKKGINRRQSLINRTKFKNVDIGKLIVLCEGSTITTVALRSLKYSFIRLKN